MEEKEKEGATKAAPAAPAFTVENDGSRVRKLLKPIETHTGKLDVIKLRKPTYRDIMSLGDPEQIVFVSGGYVPQIDMAQIEKYIVSLSGIDALLLEQVDYVDALALRDAVRDFFRQRS